MDSEQRRQFFSDSVDYFVKNLGKAIDQLESTNAVQNHITKQLGEKVAEIENNLYDQFNIQVKDYVYIPIEPIGEKMSRFWGKQNVPKAKEKTKQQQGFMKKSKGFGPPEKISREIQTDVNEQISLEKQEANELEPEQAILVQNGENGENRDIQQENQAQNIQKERTLNPQTHFEETEYAQQITKLIQHQRKKSQGLSKTPTKVEKKDDFERNLEENVVPKSEQNAKKGQHQRKNTPDINTLRKQELQISSFEDSDKKKESEKEVQMMKINEVVKEKSMAKKNTAEKADRNHTIEKSAKKEKTEKPEEKKEKIEKIEKNKPEEKIKAYKHEEINKKVKEKQKKDKKSGPFCYYYLFSEWPAQTKYV